MRPLFITTRWFVGVMLSLLALLTASLGLTLDTGARGLAVMDQIGLQRARIQAFAKNALVLMDEQASNDRRTIATAQLQNIYPLFIRTHTGLSRGDAELHLPSRVPREVLQALVDFQGGYLSVVNAVDKIISDKALSRESVVIQANIILLNEQAYASGLNKVSNLWRDNIASFYSLVFWFETVLAAGVSLLILIFYLLFEFRVFRAYPEGKEGNEKEATVPQTNESTKEAVAQDTAEESGET